MQQRAMEVRPKVGGFSALAGVLRQAGVRRNIWNLPSAESLYLTDHGPIVYAGTPLVTGFSDIPVFNQEALTLVLRINQAGESTVAEFLKATRLAGVVRYEVDFAARHVTYYGRQGESYRESYPEAKL